MREGKNGIEGGGKKKRRRRRSGQIKEKEVVVVVRKGREIGGRGKGFLCRKFDQQMVVV